MVFLPPKVNFFWDNFLLKICLVANCLHLWALLKVEERSQSVETFPQSTLLSSWLINKFFIFIVLNHAFALKTIYLFSLQPIAEDCSWIISLLPKNVWLLKLSFLFAVDATFVKFHCCMFFFESFNVMERLVLIAAAVESTVMIQNMATEVPR